MESIYSDHTEKVIKKSEEFIFTTKNKGIYLVQVLAKTRSEKQLGGTDDEDLRIEIDNRKFPQLTNNEKYFDSPAAFSGGTSKGLTKAVFFLLWLETGPHRVVLIPDHSATFVGMDIFYTGENATQNKLDLPMDIIAEDGDRRDWLTFVLVDLSLGSFAVELALNRRFLDSDDVKITINDSIKRAHHNKRQKLWFFVTSVFKGEKQGGQFEVNLPTGLHYIELAADRTPKLVQISFQNLTFKLPTTIQEKIEHRARQYGFEPKMMLRLAKRESQFDPKATSDAGAKGLFQLTSITIKQIRELGFVITEPYDVDQNIEGGFIYFKWLYERYNGEKDQIKKTLAAWNYGPARIPKKGPLVLAELPNETKNLINDVLGDHDF